MDNGHRRLKTKSNNKRFAECGDRSKWYCWKYRYLDPICKKCSLYKCRGKRSKVKKVGGVKVATCKYCGETLPLTEFYMSRKIHFDRFGNKLNYAFYIYRCKKCTEKAVRESIERRKLKNDNQPSEDFTTAAIE